MKKSILKQKANEEKTKELEVMRNNFKVLRQARYWSIKKLSEISGINKKILTNIEKGEDFDAQYLIKLCYIYQIKPHEIFSRMI